MCLVFVLVNLNPQPRTMSSPIPPKMKAVRFHQTGGPEVIVLEEIDIPDPSPEDVLIKVEWAGVNYSESPISCRLMFTIETSSYLRALLPTDSYSRHLPPERPLSRPSPLHIRH